jgi:hypothetical protein
MSKYALNIRDEAKGKNLVSFLKTLDFVQITSVESMGKPQKTGKNDFFAIKGLWRKRDITGKQLRELAWNRGSG